MVIFNSYVSLPEGYTHYALSIHPAPRRKPTPTPQTRRANSFDSGEWMAQLSSVTLRLAREKGSFMRFKDDL